MSLCRRRLDALAEDRAALNEELRRCLAATADQEAASGAGGSSGGMLPGAPSIAAAAPLLPGGLAAGDAALHELVADLGANSRRELWTLVPHYLVNLAVPTPAQLARGLAYLAPWQGNAARVADAVRHLLALSADEALPWAALQQSGTARPGARARQPPPTARRAQAAAQPRA